MTRILLIFLLAVAGLKSNASHISGGNISYQCVGPNQFLVTLTLYRDCSGIAAPASASVQFTSTCGGNFSVTLPRISLVEVSQLCPPQIGQSRCNGGTLPGMQEAIYQATVTLNPPCNTWTMRYTLCCRNPSVNVSGATGQNISIQTTMNSATNPCNNSPTVTAQPIPYICAGQQIFYDYGIQESDGHTMTYSLVNSLGNGYNNMTYNGGYSAALPIPGVNINASTGQLSFTAPAVVGNYVVAMLISEYDANGNLLGTILHDIQFVVINCTNATPQPNPINNVTGGGSQIGNYALEVCEGENFCFSITFTDANATNILTVTSNLASIFPGATINIAGTNPATATICHTPAPGTLSAAISFMAEDDACPITAFTSINVNINILTTCCLPPNMTSTPETCLGDNDGTATATPVGANGPWNYVWTQGATTIATNNGINGPNTISNLAPGTYDVAVTDVNGCTTNGTVTIAAGPSCCALTINTASTNPTCNVANAPCNGTITITSAGGIGAVSYSINNGATNQVTGTFNGLCAGNYNILVTDANGCTETAVINLTEPVAVSFTNVTQAATCNDSNGSITITPAGGVGGYQFSFDGGVTYGPSATLTNIAAGAYNTCVQDANGCTFCQIVNVNNDPAQNIDNIAIVDASCSGQCNGQVTVTVSGGTGTYQYGIDGGALQASNIFNGICVGSHNITTVDGNGCQVFGTAIVGEPNPLSFTTSFVNVACFGACDGNINFVTTTGGTGPYSYSINNGLTNQPGALFSGVCAGSYNLLVSDSQGCQFTGTITVTEPAQLQAVISNTEHVSCFGGTNGSLTAQIGGGTTPYSTQWDDPSNQTGLTASALSIGNYCITVTDNNGCAANACGNITEPALVEITNIAGTDETCSGACNGQIIVTANNALQYSIDGGITFQANGTFNGVCSGNYVVIVTGINNCPASGNITIGTPNPITLNVSNNVTICNGGSTTLTATGNGGTGVLTYSWSNGVNTATQTVNPTTTTTYSATVTDGNGCSVGPLDITVTVNPLLSLVVSLDTSVCYGQTANISATATGGNGGPYTYIWTQNPAGVDLFGANQTVQPQQSTQFTVTVTDACETPAVSATVNVNILSNPNISFAADVPSGCTVHTVNFENNTNPALAASCFWNFGDGNTSTDCNPTHSFVEPGCYNINLTVTSPDGCVKDSTAFQYVCVYALPVADFDFGPQPTTVINTLIKYNNLSSGASSYEWVFGDGNESTELNPWNNFPTAEPGTYETCLISTTVNGCKDTICKLVVIDDEFLIYVPNAFTPDGDGLNDVFLPIINGYDVTSYQMYIFNRWGETIFESAFVGLGWDGTYAGQNSKEDVYVWKIVVRDEVSGEKKQFHGHVTLIRGE